MRKPTIIFLVGCTASGKASLGRRLAGRLDAEILSVDSMKVYRRMDIGTAKPTAKQRADLPYHLIDVAEPSESFSAARFVELSEHAIADVHSGGKVVLGVGGTVLYLKALTEGIFEGPGADASLRRDLFEQADRQGLPALYDRLRRVDPHAAARIHPNDRRRIVRALEVFELTGSPISSFQGQFGRLREDYQMLFVGLRHPKDQLNGRINQRVRRMIELGFVDEVRSLLSETPPISQQARQALGYAQIIAQLGGRYDLDRAVEQIKISTRRFGKSQRTWFRRLPHVNWFDVPQDAQPVDLLDDILSFIDRYLG